MSPRRHLLILASLLVGWAWPPSFAANVTSPPSPAPPESAPVVSAFPRTLTDGTGRTVKLAEKPQRLVSLSPAITEMILAVGDGDALVGVTRYCTVPDKDPPIARVGGVLDPDYEHIVALRPDLVLLPNLASPQLLERMESLGLTVVVFSPEGIDNLPRDLRLAGQATGRDDQGEALARQFEDLRALVRARLHDLTAEHRPTAAILYGPDLLASSPEGFAGQLLDEAGARNVVPVGPLAWPELTPEALLRLDPEVIFLVRDSTTESWPPASQPALHALAAVRKGRVVDLPESLFQRPGPLLGEALWTLARALYPSRFPETTASEALAHSTTAVPVTPAKP